MKHTVYVLTVKLKLIDSMPLKRSSVYLFKRQPKNDNQYSGSETTES